MPSIAIVGAGPGMGLAIARTFGSHGFDVALIARNRTKLDDLVARLAADGITAAAFPADVLDRDALTRALERATAHVGGIDVLEYSPVGGLGSTVLTAPSETDPSDVQHELQFQLYGAIAATRAVLPAMREAGTGTLLYTTGAGSIDPVPQIANVNAAAAALRNWVINLHKELAGTGVQAAHVAIDVSVDTPAFPGAPTAPAEEIARVYWDLHTNREDPETIFTTETPWAAVAPPAPH
ncbi:SDR family NAD(P)-dependent oxidoreductase [Pseudonocardia sp. DSM 110487]|uniref:SDR family NAD(P)-dependent oxidoreductase n=1 Tax=Pseudonocardia sp. DSM 110487 TaxID=2865833 RepID=UPI001C69C495|nr:SDR family NAD(P)-dependent oxidoreductase [Pseudonocardia sp. DSM 110487]QYN34030.1 SDR family NAD(P)-dependent oxidoreductase [Pseudonocardia sp. DSM 110487]